MTSTVVPFTEPWQRTATRTILLALAIGAVLAFTRHQPALILPLFLFALWFTLGGHFIEILFRNRLRQHLPSSAPLLLAIRLGYWFLGGAALYLIAIALTPMLPPRWFSGGGWWIAGLAFVLAELVIHASMAARRLPSVYNGQG